MAAQSERDSLPAGSSCCLYIEIKVISGKEGWLWAKGELDSYAKANNVT